MLENGHVCLQWLGVGTLNGKHHHPHAPRPCQSQGNFASSLELLLNGPFLRSPGQLRDRSTLLLVRTGNQLLWTFRKLNEGQAVIDKSQFEHWPTHDLPRLQRYCVGDRRARLRQQVATAYLNQGLTHSLCENKLVSSNRYDFLLPVQLMM